METSLLHLDPLELDLESSCYLSKSYGCSDHTQIRFLVLTWSV